MTERGKTRFNDF